MTALDSGLKSSQFGESFMSPLFPAPSPHLPAAVSEVRAQFPVRRNSDLPQIPYRYSKSTSNVSRCDGCSVGGRV